MTDLQSTIQRLNLHPINKEAAEILSRMKIQHNPDKLAILELAEAKADEEELDRQSREELNIYIPQGTSGADLRMDLSEIVENLTPEMAERITEEFPGADGTAEETTDAIISSLTREQWEYLGLRTPEP